MPPPIELPIFFFFSQHNWKREGKMSHAENLCWVLPPVNNLALQCSHEIDFQANNRTMEFKPSTQLAKMYVSIWLFFTGSCLRKCMSHVQITRWAHCQCQVAFSIVSVDDSSYRITIIRPLHRRAFLVYNVFLFSSTFSAVSSQIT